MISTKNVGLWALTVALAGCGGQPQEPAAPLAPDPGPAAVEPVPIKAPDEPEPPPPPPPITGEERAKWYASCWDNLNKKDWTAFGKCYAESATHEEVDSPVPPITGRANLVGHIQRTWSAAFPDLTGEIQLTLISGNKIAAAALVRGTNTGPMQSPGGEQPPTGKKIGVLMGHHVDTADGGEVTHERGFFDTGWMMASLGRNPSPSRTVMEKGWPEKIVVIAKGDETEKKNVEMYQRGVEAFTKHDAKALGADLADDVVWFETGLPKDLNKKAALATAQAMWKGFSDLKITPSDVWGAGDYVVALGTLTGTNDGDVKSMKIKKTGKTVSIKFLEIQKIKDGKIKNGWLFYDGFAFANQLGLIPPPGAPGDKAAKGGDKKAAAKAEKKAAPAAEKKAAPAAAKP